MEKLFISELSKIKINIKKANIDKNAKVAFKKTYVRKKDIRLLTQILILKKTKKKLFKQLKNQYESVGA